MGVAAPLPAQTVGQLLPHLLTAPLPMHCAPTPLIFTVCLPLPPALPVVQYLPGIIATLALIMINCVRM